MTDIHIADPEMGVTGDDCERILRALPEWFGIEAALQDYVQSTHDLPTILASVDDTVIGFLTLKYHNSFSAEIYVMAIHPDYHRHGIGRKMIRVAEHHLVQDGLEYLQVKTLAESHPDPNYAKTRHFYRGLGFRPIEVFPTLWGEANPCLLMVKVL